MTDERARLHGYIEASRRVQRRLRGLLIAGAAAAVAVWWFDHAWGWAAAVLVAIVIGCGYWVTAAHIADWRGRLAHLDQRRRDGGTPRAPVARGRGFDRGGRRGGVSDP
ncbi:MAG: hypothetical protein H6708_28200 [Kofleriaceae bacterium]|nr:hypothetical protein [Kofleriaceae bacterium]